MSRKDNLLLMKSWERLKNSILKRLSELLRSLDGSPQEAEGVEAHLGREQTPPQSSFSCCCDTDPDKTVEGRIGFLWLQFKGESTKSREGGRAQCNTSYCIQSGRGLSVLPTFSF